MSYRDNKNADHLFPKTNRNDRYKQMTKQQQLIEEKKRQIQEKLDQKKKGTEESNVKADCTEVKIERKPLVFSNDGSFLDQFKKMSGMSASQIDSLNNGNQNERKINVSENNNQNNREVSGRWDSGDDAKQGYTHPAPLPPDRPPPMNYQQLQQHYHQQHQPPPHYLPFGVPPPPPPIPPPLIPQSAPPPLIPQSIPPPRPINVQNIPPPPLGLPIPPVPPCFPPPPPSQYQNPHPGPPMHNYHQLPPPNFNHPQVPPENVQQGTAPGCMAPGPPARLDHFQPPSQPPHHCPSNNNHWYPPSQPNNTNSIPPLMQDHKPEIKLDQHDEFDINQRSHRSDRKRKSRWSDDKEMNIPPPVELVASVPKINVTGMSGHMLTKVTRTDPGLLQYALTAYGSTILTEEDWKKAEENYKVHLLYQDMMAKRAALEKLKGAGKHKYEYDSDEEIDEKGTWEHKLRDKEMMATQQWAESLTEMAKGKHHIGDFLPPDELKKFLAKYQAAKGGREPDLSDYKEYKLGEENKGFQMLQKLGWTEGQGLGSDGGGRLDPINKGQMREFNEGLGHLRPDDIGTDDDEYDAYRKRMMLAYRFRPNPLNNPRRPYY